MAISVRDAWRHHAVAPSVEESPASLDLRLLGAFELRVDGRDVDVPRASQRVLAFLALHRGLLRRAFVAESLWPETSDERSHACLRSAVWRLRSREVRLLMTTVEGMRLGDDVRVDLTEQGHIAVDLTSGSRPPEASATALFESELLPDWPDDWLCGWREAWHQVRLHALEQSARAYTAVSEFGRALEAAMAALRADPLRESAHRVVITVHLAEGNYAEARRQYEACSRLLHSELGISPSKLTRNLLSAYVATLDSENET